MSRTSECVGLISYIGSHGWALGIEGCAEYPEVTSDHGKTWRIGGIYFAIPGAGGAAFVDVIKPFTPRIVTAFYPGESTFDVTWDGGRHWYAAWMPGNVVSVAQQLPNAGTSKSGGTVIEVKVFASKSPSNEVAYLSQDDGRKWKLVIPKTG
jgi:hypothetical protein